MVFVCRHGWIDGNAGAWLLGAVCSEFGEEKREVWMDAQVARLLANVMYHTLSPDLDVSLMPSQSVQEQRAFSDMTKLILSTSATRMALYISRSSRELLHVYTTFTNSAE